jgi:hypothetical protein
MRFGTVVRLLRAAGLAVKLYHTNFPGDGRLCPAAIAPMSSQAFMMPQPVKNAFGCGRAAPQCHTQKPRISSRVLCLRAQLL